LAQRPERAVRHRVGSLVSARHGRLGRRWMPRVDRFEVNALYAHSVGNAPR
jgi:hypothetical protein